MSDFQAWAEKNKALWTRVYDEVIAPDLEEEWEKREEKHKQELQKRDDSQLRLYNHVSEQIEKNARLVEENRELQSQIQAQEAAASPSRPGQEYHKLSEKFEDMNKKYQDMTQKIRYLERKNQAVMQKNKDMKESVRLWQDYADRRSGKHKSKGDASKEDASEPSKAHHLDEMRPPIPSSPGSAATNRTPRSLADCVGLSSPQMALADPGVGGSRQSRRPETPVNTGPPLASGSSVASMSTSAAGITATRGPDSGVNTFRRAAACLESERRSYAEPHGGHPTSSQTTVDEPTEPPTNSAYIGDDSDVPEFVSERCLKRKREPPSRITVYTDCSEGTQAKPFHVKDEPPSSPPPIINTLSRKETLDLDEPVPYILLTPRHPKQGPSAKNHSKSTAHLQHQRSNSEQPSQPIKQEKDTDVQELPSGDSCMQTRIQATSETRANSEPTDSSSNNAGILQPIDSNMVIEPIEGSVSNKRLKKGSIRRNSRAAMAVESDEDPNPNENDSCASFDMSQRSFGFQKPKSIRVVNAKPTKHKTPKSAPAKVKFESKTRTNSPERTDTPSRAGLRSGRPTASVPASPEDKPIDSRPIWSMKAPSKRITGQQCTSGSSTPDKQTPLRSKPLSELVLQDFRPNPSHNQGYSHAFSETVRKRGDRMCLPGCTSSACCGSTFRVLAETMAPLAPTQEETLLQEYLGDAYDVLVSTQMAGEERVELVLQARTRQIARDNGKHREAFERRRTPPGFWRIDFPTTQEMAEDRARAREVERKAVEERWLEAQRKGGRWIFRDECQG